MKYTIEGFNQEYATTLKKFVEKKGKQILIQIDCTDLVILRWFVDFFPKMEKHIIKNKEFGWINHNKLMNDLPLINISRQSFIERMQKLVEFEILEYQLLKNIGNKSVYSFGKNYSKLIENTLIGSNQQALIGSNQQGLSIQTDNYNSINYKNIIDIYHEMCPSLPKCKTLSNKRKRQIHARLENYTIEQIKEVFRNAENSDFLKGVNDRSWKADFDWLMNDNNFAKTLEGKYQKQFIKKISNFSTGRQYTREEMNNLFQSVDEIEI